MSSSKGHNPQCQHPDKYEISTDGDPVSELPYPSRLGFFHIAERGAVIHYVEINKKLCRSCCDLLVPNGEYLVWSVLAGTSAADVVAKLATLVPGDGHFPPIIQAGSELKDTSQGIALPIPDIPGAKQAWEWLEAQGKPFYIDQLHIVPGQRMSPLTRKRVAKDSLVALRYGQAFTLDGIQPASNVSALQAAPAVADTQDMVDSALSVKENTKPKKSSSKKKSNEEKSEEKKPSTKKKSDREKSEEKKSSAKKQSNEEKSEDKSSTKKEPDEEESEEKKVEKKKSGGKTSSEKAKKEKKDKQPAQMTEITTSPEISSTISRDSKSSTVLLEPTGTDSEATSKTRKTSSTNSVEVLPSLPTTGPHSTPSLAAESKPLIPILGVAATESGDIKAAKIGAHTTSVTTTTVATLSRSWGWSEPFEFTTAPKKVPALSDYERVAESRAPSQSVAKSLDTFLEGHLKLDAPRKLLGPGDFKPVLTSISGGASSSPSKRSILLHAAEQELIESNVHGKESSLKKTTKHSGEEIKPKSLAGKSTNSGSSEISKPAKSPEKTSGVKSNASGKTGHTDMAASTKPSPEKTSEQSKHKPHKDASSTGNHRTDKKAMSTDHSTHQKKSVTSSKEIHEKEVKMKTTSSGPGSLSGLGKATANYLSHKLNEATEKKPKKDKVDEEKPSKPQKKPDENKRDKKPDEHKPDEQKPDEQKPDGQKPNEHKPDEKPPGHPEGNHQSENSEPEPGAHTAAHPPLPSQDAQGLHEHQLHGDPEVDGPVPSTLPGGNATQLDEPGAPSLSLPVDNPGQANLQDQAGPLAQTYPPAQMDAPVPTGAIGATQPGQSAAPYGMPETGPFAESNTSVQATAEFGWGQDPSSQLPSQGGGAPTSYPPFGVSVSATANSAAAVGEPAVQSSTVQPETLSSSQGETTSPAPPNGLGIFGPGSQSTRPFDTPGSNQFGSHSLAEVKPPSTLPGLHTPGQGPSSRPDISNGASTLPTAGSTQAPDAPSDPSKPANSDASANQGSSAPHTSGVQVLLEAGTAGTGTGSKGLPTATHSDGRGEPPVETADKSPRTDALPGLEIAGELETPDSKHKSHPKGSESPSGDSPTKGFGASADPGIQHQDHKKPRKPKRTHSTKPGGPAGHGKSGHGSHARRPSLKQHQAPKRPSGGRIAAGVVVGVAGAAALASLAGNSGPDDSSGSDSDQDSNHSDVHGDDHESNSEGEDEVELGGDGVDSSHDAAASEHSESDDDGPGDDEDQSDTDGSDGDEDPLSDAVPASDDENSLDSDDNSSNGGSDNEADDDDEDGSGDGTSSESDGSDDESDGEEDEDEDGQSESQPSGDESEDGDGDTPAGETSDSDGNASSDEEHDDHSSEGEENDSGQDDDDEGTERDGSSNGDDSEADEEDSGDNAYSSGED